MATFLPNFLFDLAKVLVQMLFSSSRNPKSIDGFTQKRWRFFFLFVKHCTKNVMSTIHLIVFFLFWKEVFSFQMPFVHKNFFLLLSFLKSIWILWPVIWWWNIFFKKKALIHHFCCILFISIQNVRDFFYYIM